MQGKKIRMLSVEVAKRLNSLVKVYDAKTMKLKRIETQDGRVVEARRE